MFRISNNNNQSSKYEVERRVETRSIPEQEMAVRLTTIIHSEHRVGIVAADAISRLERQQYNKQLAESIAAARAEASATPTATPEVIAVPIPETSPVTEIQTSGQQTYQNGHIDANFARSQVAQAHDFKLDS